jgi:formate hydrogenlyase transcriptional activator
MFYRLNVFPIRLPALRERIGDIPILVEFLVERYSRKTGKRFNGISKQTIELLQAYEWPGNIRELQNVVERAVILSEGDVFTVDEAWLRRDSMPVSGPRDKLSATLADREREMIEAALAESRGRISGPSGAAARLGLPRQTLDSKIVSLQIRKGQFKTPPAT